MEPGEESAQRLFEEAPVEADPSGGVELATARTGVLSGGLEVLGMLVRLCSSSGASSHSRSGEAPLGAALPAASRPHAVETPQVSPAAWTCSANAVVK
eukprot:CAMPEP_0171130236 /NCGR_PEP_ID=MMETSP0766_2-20121228/120532_1 /TAXON_ID=439317 /ORGANISM="Gambierdiscus australes, Strain CAWD 149" /LENGTH=97 /DNA_ID=CAMNT_0011593475 /DNA_START=372 /DNA_END=663 /DNA_ORIENTATION=-